MIKYSVSLDSRRNSLAAVRGSVLLACALLSALFFASCYSTPTRDRGSLKDAMDAARDDSDDRSVPDKPRFPYDDPYDDPYRTPYVPAPDHSTSEASFDLSPIDAQLALGLRYGMSPYVSGDVSRISDITLLLGITADSMELFFTGSGKVIEPTFGSDLYLSTADNLTMLSLGGEFRHIPYSERTCFFPWIGFGFDAFLMGWEFRNPLVAGSETITSDMLGGFTMYPSLGVYITRNDLVSVSLFALPAISFFRDVTAEGFTNDFFDPLLSCQAGIEVLLR